MKRKKTSDMKQHIVVIPHVDRGSDSDWLNLNQTSVFGGRDQFHL